MQFSKSSWRHLALFLCILGFQTVIPRGKAQRTRFIPDSKAKVWALVLPQEEKVLVTNKLYDTVNRAKEKILIAMYWLTYQPFINKLIELKRKKNLDIQVIIDESMLGQRGANGKIDKLIENGIVPLIFPSKSIKGIMHHKFIVVDDHAVWTGSANLTGSVLGKSDYINNENIVVIYSWPIAQQFGRVFYDLQEEIFQEYIRLISEGEKLPYRLRRLSHDLYSTDPEFRIAVLEQLHSTKLSDVQKGRLSTFFETARQKRPREKSPPIDIMH